MFFDSPVAIVWLALLVGLCIGSFLNVVIHRLPKMMELEWHEQCAELRGETIAATPRFNLSRPRSRCPSCGHRITAKENIPVISYLLLRGRCSGCGALISPRYPLIELTTGMASAFAAWHFGFQWSALGALILVWALIALAAIDFDTQLLPDSITLPLLWIGLAFNLNGVMADISSAVLGAMIGYLALWGVFWAFKLATGKEGMGYGDFKLLAALGAWLGWEMLPAIILLSSVVGALVGVALIIFAKRGRDIPIPFGPYLASAGIIALFWGRELTRSYLSLLT